MVLRDPCVGGVFVGYSGDWVKVPSPSGDARAVLGNLPGADTVNSVCGVVLAHEVRYAASGTFSCGVVFSESSSDLLEAPSPNVATGAVLGSLSGADTVDSLCGVALVYEVTCFAASGAFFGGREPQAKG